MKTGIVLRQMLRERRRGVLWWSVAIAALTAGLNFQQVEKFFSYKAVRESDHYQILLTPRSGGIKRMVKELSVRVDNDFKIQRTETTLPKGGRVVTTYRNQRPTPIPASAFEFTPPADVQVTQPLGK